MSGKFKLDEKLILTLLLIIFSLSLTIPAIHFLNDISVKILIFLAVLIVNFSISGIFNKKIIKPGLIDFLFIITSLIFFVSCFYVNLESNLDSYSLFTIFTYIMNFVLFFLILSRRFRLSDEKFDKFTNIILFIAFVLSIVSMIFFYLGLHFIPLYNHTSAGLFGHPNTTSMFYTICIPVLFYKFFTDKIELPVFISLLILFLIVLLFTFSRAGYIGVGVGILIYTFYKSRWLFVIVSLLVAVIAYTIVIDFATSKVDSSASRLLLMLAAFSIITNSETSLLWGYGPVNAVNVFIQEKIFFGNEPVPNPHNLILQLTMQFGILFTLFMTLTVVTLLIKGMILKFTDIRFRNDQRLNLSMTIIISLLVQNFFEDVVVNPLYYVMPLFFLFSGYIYYSISLKNQIEAETVK